MSSDRPPGGPAGGADPAARASSPAEVADLAAACVRFVKEAVGFDLDGSPETLPVVDHWLEQARAAVPEGERGELGPQLRLAALAAGAYFGEVVLGQHEGWWRADSRDASGELRVELARAFVSFSPMAMAAALLTRPEDGELPPRLGEDDDDEDDEAAANRPRPEMDVEVPPPPESPFEELGGFLLDEPDRAEVAARLAEIPVRSQREYYALSTKLEVLELCVAALTEPFTSRAEEPPRYEPGDYEPS